MEENTQRTQDRIVSGQNTPEQDVQGQEMAEQNVQEQEMPRQDSQGQGIAEQDVQEQEMPRQDSQRQGIAEQDVQEQEMPRQDSQGQGIAEQDSQEQGMAEQDVPAQGTFRQEDGRTAQAFTGSGFQQTARDTTGYGAAPAIAPDGSRRKGGNVNVVLIIGIIVLLAALLGTAGFYIYKNIFLSPQARVARGFAHLGNELNDYKNPIGEKLGWDQIDEMLVNGASSTDVKLNVTVPELDSATIGMDFKINCDNPNKLMNVAAKLSAFNMELLSAQYAEDSGKAYVTLPDFLTGSLMVDAVSTGKSFNESALAEITGMQADEEFSLSIFGDRKGETEEEDDRVLFSDGFEKKITEDVAVLAAGLVIEATDDVLELRHEDKVQKCRGYRILLKEEDVNNLFRDIYEELRNGRYADVAKKSLQADLSWYTDEEIDDTWEDTLIPLQISVTGDVELVLYLDKKDRIVHMATPEMLKLSNPEEETGIAFSLDLNGDKRALDTLRAILKYETEDENITLDLTRDAELTETTYSNIVSTVLTLYDNYFDETQTLDMVYRNEWNLDSEEFEMELSFASKEEDEDLGVILKGNFEEIEKGESFTLNLGSLHLMENDESIIKVSGSCKVGALEKEIVIPQDNVRDLFGMSRGEVEELYVEVYGKAMEYAGRFSLLPL